MRLFEKNITEQENGWTAEQVLRRSLGLSTTRIKRAKFRPDGILLDGVRINTAQRVRLGQHLELHLPELEENCLESAPGAVDIIYEDEWLLVVNKPAGLPVHPGPGHYADTLGNRLAGFYRQRGKELVFRPVNRLDKGTSGLMLCAKRAESHEALQNLLHTDEFQRDYLALLSRAPRPPRGTVDTPIAPVPGALNCYRTDPEGKTRKRIMSPCRAGRMELWCSCVCTPDVPTRSAFIWHPSAVRYWATSNMAVIQRFPDLPYTRGVSAWCIRSCVSRWCGPHRFQMSSESWGGICELLCIPTRCADGTLYTGYTDDPVRRTKIHNAGKGAKYTRARLPVELVYQEACADKSAALRREYEIKQLTRVQKLKLIEQS